MVGHLTVSAKTSILDSNVDAAAPIKASKKHGGGLGALRHGDDPLTSNVEDDGETKKHRRD
jgi:hypothetical protein